jgi:hypothetical protein
VKFVFKTLKAIGASAGAVVAKTVATTLKLAVSGVKLVATSVQHTVAKVVTATKALFVGASVAGMLAVSHAYAQTIGQQLGLMAQEGSTAGGTIASTVMYVGALVIFTVGAWALWQSRDPASREPGKVGQGIAAMVLCGLMVSGGLWIGKASQTATGAAAVETSAAAVVGF